MRTALIAIVGIACLLAAVWAHGTAKHKQDSFEQFKRVAQEAFE